MLVTASTRPRQAPLIASGLLTETEIATSDVVISETGGRHTGWRVERAAGPSLHIKQAFTSNGAAALAHEARVINLVASASDESLCALPPTLRAYDADAAVLATALVPNGRTLNHCVVETPGAALEAAAALGRGLAGLHRAGTLVPTLGEAACPGVLGLHRPTPALLQRLSAAGRRLVELIQAHPDFGAALDTLRATWCPSTPTHNDLKWDNIVVQVTPHGGCFEGVSLVDWENAGLGEPGWDIGSFFGAGLTAWARGQPDNPDRQAEAALSDEPYPIALVQLLCQAFWSAYRQQREDEPPLGPTTMRYCAARLVQTALELTQDRIELPDESTRLLQLALNIVQRPAEAAATLVGIDIPGSPAYAAPAPAKESPQERFR